jgi:serine phosphatase RsbU (regulator of sigma subunit)
MIRLFESVSFFLGVILKHPSKLKKKKEWGEEPKIRDTVWNDIKRGNVNKSLTRDFRDLYDFYIDPKTKERLASLGRIRRWIHTLWLILKRMILKLTPGRRLILLVSFILILFESTGYQNNQVVEGIQIDIKTQLIGYALVLVVLMLELKDKLLARDELEAGRKIQAALMPDEHPSIPGWDVWLYTRPANDVGGDLVDYIKLDQNRYGFALGDIAGKGLGAALLMAKLQASIRALVPMAKGLEWLGSQLNQIFHRDCLPSRFASLIYFEIDINSGSISILNAGHIPPIMIQKNRMKDLDLGDPALGLMEKTRYKKMGVRLDVDDLLFGYSDGLVETRNKDSEFFGDLRVRQLIRNFGSLPTKDLGEKILEEIGSFQGDFRHSDDLSMIIIKRKE